MTELSLQFSDNNYIGRVVAVDTSRVRIDVDNPLLLTRAGVGNLIATKGPTESEYLTVITERVKDAR